MDPLRDLIKFLRLLCAIRKTWSYIKEPLPNSLKWSHPARGRIDLPGGLKCQRHSTMQSLLGKSLCKLKARFPYGLTKFECFQIIL